MRPPRPRSHSKNVYLVPLRNSCIEEVAIIEMVERVNVAATEYDHVLLIGCGSVSSPCARWFPYVLYQLPEMIG